MSSMSFEYLQSQPLGENKIIGESMLHGSLYHVCAWKGKPDPMEKVAPLYLYLVRNKEFFPGGEGFKEMTHAKIWTVWEKRVALEASSKEGICSLKEEGFAPHSSADPNVFHVDAIVVAEKKEESKEVCLAVKRIAYELFMSTPSTISEMHFCLTKDDCTGIARDSDDFEIIRDSNEERSVGWGRSFKMDKVRDHPPILV